MTLIIPSWLKILSWIWALNYTLFSIPLFFAEEPLLDILVCVFWWALSASLYYLDKGEAQK